MRHERDAFTPESNRLPVNSGEYLNGQQRISQQNANSLPGGQRDSAKSQRRVEQSSLRVVVFNVDEQSLGRLGQLPAISHVHRHERRDVECLFRGARFQRALFRAR